MAADPLSIDSGVALPLEEGPYHIHITVPFALVVWNFNPKTASPPRLWKPRSTHLATRLFGSRGPILTSPSDRAKHAALPHLRELWKQLSPLLFEQKETKPAMFSVTSCDVDDWGRVNESTLFWTTATTTPLYDKPLRVMVLEGTGTGDGGIKFTLEEIGDAEKEAWRAECSRTPAPRISGVTWPSAQVETVTVNVVERNLVLNRWMSGRIHNSWRSQGKESFESSVPSTKGRSLDHRRSTGWWCCSW
jgi:hypothetical protein